ncbi:MAG: tRNA pseudouridine(38-40) synthase TruA [Candidatus Omnitrophica bacterium]|nr:tRNA pseudouridine(38-40) synthase TruA [Candidatus Omnitrophota bacterium]MDD5654958.1 tRNA pseudouridine(38-40) synthase TruA [Candidatus Omnitrophota bacterium]
MRNLRLLIEYDGTPYCGWQTQTRNKSKKSIQEILEAVLSRILQEKIKVIGSGRTDAGVHAAGQVANFKTGSGIPLPKLRRALNSLLPDEIVIKSVKEVSLSFHSRYSAKSKRYRYTILNRPFPCALSRDFMFFYPRPLDVKLMKKAARPFVGRHDFSAFRNADKKEASSVRTIKSLKLKKEGDRIHIDIEGDGFLYNMVRSIAGTLIEVGRGRIAPGEARKILRGKRRDLAGPTAPAKGLCLVSVKYK